MLPKMKMNRVSA